jgi:hypothetical protein
LGKNVKKGFGVEMQINKQDSIQETLSPYSHSFGIEAVQEEALPLQNDLRPVALPVQQFAQAGRYSA